MFEDRFGFWQIKNTRFAGCFEIPRIQGTAIIPNDLHPFSKRNQENTDNKSLHFYEYDQVFDTVISSEKKMLKNLPVFKKYLSVISPDPSIYRDMPLVMQLHQIYKSRAIGSWMEQQNIPVTPNVRWGDKRTYSFCFEGLQRNAIVAVGSLGGLKNKDNRIFFENGFLKMLEVLSPSAILIYGNLPAGLKTECLLQHIFVKEYQAEISKAHNCEGVNGELFNNEIP